MHAIPTQAVLLWLRKARQNHQPQQLPELYQGTDVQTALKLRPLIVVATLFFTGARAQEICNLEQSDVIVTDGLVQFYFDSLKHGVTRTIPVQNHFLAYLVKSHRLAWPASARSPFIFTVKQVHPYPRLIHRIVATEFPGFSPHSFRHHFASLLASEGVPMPVIQQSLGHRHLNTTSIYLQKLATSQTSEVWRKFDAQLSQEDLF